MGSPRSLLAIVIAVIAPLSFTRSQDAPPTDGKLLDSSQRLSRGLVYVSPTGQCAVARVPSDVEGDRTNSFQFVSRDHESPAFSASTSAHAGLIFPPVGERFAYMVQRGHPRKLTGPKTVIVFDGENVHEHPGRLGRGIFDPTGTRFAYSASPPGDAAGRMRAVYVNGERVGPVAVGDIEFVQWTTDGKLVVTREGDPKLPNPTILEVDGERLTDQLIWHPAIAQDGTIAFGARDGRKARVYIDGKRGPAFDEVRPPEIGDDGETPVYAARKGQKWYITVGHKTLRRSYPTAPTQITVASDGETVAFVMGVGSRGGQQVYVGSKKGPTFDRIAKRPHFAPGTKTVAYVGEKDAKYHVIFGRDRSPELELEPEEIVFHPGGDEIAYAFVRGREHFVMHGEREFGPYRWCRNLTYSPDGSRLAFETSRRFGDSHDIVIGDRTIEKIHPPFRWSDDGSAISYAEVTDDGVWWRVRELD